MNRTRFRLSWPLSAMITTAGCFLLTTAGVSAANVLDQWYWRDPYPNGNDLRGVAYGAGTFVAVGTLGTIMTSSSGHVWKLRESGVSAQLNQVVYAQGAFVAVGNAFQSSGLCVFSVRSAAVLGSSNVSTPKTQELYRISPALKPAAPEDGRTPLNRYSGFAGGR